MSEFDTADLFALNRDKARRNARRHRTRTRLQFPTDGEATVTAPPAPTPTSTTGVASVTVPPTFVVAILLALATGWAVVIIAGWLPAAGTALVTGFAAWAMYGRTRSTTAPSLTAAVTGGSAVAVALWWPVVGALACVATWLAISRKR